MMNGVGIDAITDIQAIRLGRIRGRELKARAEMACTCF
jgi:hypothetical protein